MKSVEKNKELIIYIAVAYGVTFLMGMLMWYGNNKNIDLGIFPNAQMFYPAAGVMMAVLCTRKNDAMIPRVFYVFFICVTVAFATVAVVSILNPYAMIDAGNGYWLPVWSWVSELLMIVSGIVGWIILLATKKEKRRAYGLCWNNGVSSWFCIFLFFALYMLRTVIAVLCSGELGEFVSLVKESYTVSTGSDSRKILSGI
ncbi:MAG: hypothetical protein K2H91_01595 [Lachnospiraceae bacterium]|nr:hypothetical protein [Lachnospiraceae bacterium]